MRSGGRSSSATDGVVLITFGDDCPGCGTGVAVHQAVIPLIDEGGDVVQPQYYALCCKCHQDQYITKYGVEFLQPCGCDDVPLAAVARAGKIETERRSAETEARISEWRANFIRDRESAKSGTIEELGAPVVAFKE